MPDDALSKPSFLPHRRWSAGLQVLVLLVVVFSVVVMANVLSRDHPLRLHLSTQTRLELSPRTLSFLHSMTNRVRVTLYYDKEAPLYSTIADLLTEYQLANSRISVQSVDYLREVGLGEKIKTQYDLGPATNLIIFDCEGRGKSRVPGNLLEEATLEQVPNGQQLEWRRRPTAFRGEMAFTGALLAVTSPKPPKAYFLTGHGEHQIESNDGARGYSKFASVLQENYIEVAPLPFDTNAIPADCNLLIIAGPTAKIPDLQLNHIAQYLTQGGRLLALFNVESYDTKTRVWRETGLEKILARWGVAVGSNVIRDEEHSSSPDRSDVIVSAFSRHPLVNPLMDNGLFFILPRSIGKLSQTAQSVDGVHVEEVAFTGTNAIATDSAPARRRFPLMVAVERTPLKGVITERGTTRMIVAGDSFCLANNQLDGTVLANREFAGLAASWLLDRTQLLEGGPGPRPVQVYKLVMTKTRLQQAEMILLAGMPGAVLVLGGLVWLRRRR
jgi:hypothetical protein